MGKVREKRKKPNTPFCDHGSKVGFGRWCPTCLEIRRRILEEPVVEVVSTLDWRWKPPTNYELQVMYEEARKSWLDDLSYTERNIYVDLDGIEYTFVDGHKIRVPKELTSLEEFSKRLRSRE